ncbi:replication protein A 70 kDa DNA-binding subunit A-like [Cryptomeria japonica]|uniref:replication protein A 70 kDa DNA-binding subunit A-like n=1 Tax=Cryptomeria japonica TaxID=3369 RepID=UPI0027DA883D|nr:replication protein A 70 kDa DNA-binding subunit A-like [Cryptomeria japonica]
MGAADGDSVSSVNDRKDREMVKKGNWQDNNCTPQVVRGEGEEVIVNIKSVQSGINTIGTLLKVAPSIVGLCSNISLCNFCSANVRIDWWVLFEYLVLFCDYFTGLPSELGTVNGLKLQGCSSVSVLNCLWALLPPVWKQFPRIVGLFMFFNCLWAWLLDFHDVHALNWQLMCTNVDCFIGLVYEVVGVNGFTLPGSHYIISKGSVKEANARYNKLNNHLEITLSDTSILKRCTNEEQLDRQSPPFTPINELFHLTNNTLVDIIGLVLYVGDIIPIHRKDGSQTQKCLVKINDLSGSTIDINLWGPMVEQKGLELKNMLTNDSVLILALHNAHVGYFNGKLINITTATTLHINPSFLEAELLTLRGKDPLLVVPFVAKTIHIDGRYTRMTISLIRERMSIKPETIQITLLVVLHFVNVNDQNFYYATCLLIVNGRPYKKKCTQHADDSWFCSRCQMTMQDCNYSYLLPLKLQDATGTLWATTFDEGGIHLLHKTAKQLYALQNDTTTIETPSSMIKTLLSCYYSFIVLVSTKTYNSEMKMKVIVNKVAPVDFKVECHALLPEIGCLSTNT